jgi:signal transduction histidine kinase
LAEFEAPALVSDASLISLEPVENYSIRSVIEKLASDSRKLNETLSLVKSVMGLTLKAEDFARTDLLNLISDHLEAKKIEIAEHFTCEVRGAHVLLEIHADSIRSMIDQLLANAQKHGFKKASKGNKIVFSVREDRDRRVAIIEYSNNGEPFLLSEQDFVSFFQKSKDSTGSGIGGNYIYRVVKAHKGELSVKENQKRGFSMSVEIPMGRDSYE